MRLGLCWQSRPPPPPPSPHGTSRAHPSPSTHLSAQLYFLQFPLRKVWRQYDSEGTISQARSPARLPAPAPLSHKKEAGGPLAGAPRHRRRPRPPPPSPMAQVRLKPQVRRLQCDVDLPGSAEELRRGGRRRTTTLSSQRCGGATEHASLAMITIEDDRAMLVPVTEVRVMWKKGGEREAWGAGGNG